MAVVGTPFSSIVAMCRYAVLQITMLLGELLFLLKKVEIPSSNMRDKEE